MLVSIIVPTYNRAHLIGETLESILAQTYQNWECVVVDDGSKDGTDAVVFRYSQYDSRIKFFQRPKKHLSGGNGARNYGYLKSKGELIKWFDSDDLMHPKLLEVQVKDILKNKTQLTFCNLKILDSVDTFNPLGFEKIENLLKDFITRKIKLNLQSILFSKKSLKKFKFDEKLRKAQDLDFIYEILKEKPTYSYTNQNLCEIRLHNQRISADYKNFNKKMLLSSIKVKEKILLNEYDKLEQDEKDRLLTQYLSEIKSLLYTFDISRFLKKIKILRKNKIISFFYSLQIIISSFRISLNEMIWRYLKKIYKIIKKL